MTDWIERAENRLLDRHLQEQEEGHAFVEWCEANELDSDDPESQIRYDEARDDALEAQAERQHEMRNEGW